MRWGPNYASQVMLRVTGLGWGRLVLCDAGLSWMSDMLLSSTAYDKTNEILLQVNVSGDIVQ